MWSNLFDYWKELSLFGALSLPLAGLFFLSTKSVLINWQAPSGHYTQLKLFIRKNVAARQTSSINNIGVPNQQYQLIKASAPAEDTNELSGVDLLAEYPLTYLDKESYWRYCLPKQSQLNNSTSTAVTSSDATEECKLKWKTTSEAKTTNYLLELGMQFFKLQHQMNLFMIYHLGKNIANDDLDPNKSQILSKCNFQASKEGHYLKDFFISTTPISKNCFLTPREVKLTLEIGEAGSPVQTGNGSTALTVEELKKGKVHGSIKYSISSYDGELHNFSESSGHSNPEKPTLIEIKGKVFKLDLENAASDSSGNSLKFKDLFDKYKKRELSICDFWKDYESSNIAGGGASNHCATQ